MRRENEPIIPPALFSTWQKRETPVSAGKEKAKKVSEA